MSSKLKSMILPLATDQSPNLLEFIARQQDLIAQQQKQIVQLQEREVQLLARIEVLESEIIRLEKVIPVNKQQANAQYWCLNWFWDIYRDLKAFKAEPSEAKASLIRQEFDNLVYTQTDCTELQSALGGLEVIKKELLLVLDDPSLPLHNNLSESQIREHVKRRKISGGTRSDAGRQCRDTFASLKKTCRQHGLFGTI